MGLIEQKHLDAAMKAGACDVEEFRVGDEIGTVLQGDLIWFEENCTDLAREASGGVPLWALAWYGHGHGDGDGDGSGYGYGSGDGDGYAHD